MSELEKPSGERDYDMLNKLIGNLKFFLKFPEEIRYELLKLATLRKYEKDDIVFR